MIVQGRKGELTPQSAVVQAGVESLGFDGEAPPCLAAQREQAEEAWGTYGRRYGEEKARQAPPHRALEDLVRTHGVCGSQRRPLWLEWSGGRQHKDKRPYEYSALVLKLQGTLLFNTHNPSDGRYRDELRQIEKDVERTCQEHPFFRAAPPSEGSCRCGRCAGAAGAGAGTAAHGCGGRAALWRVLGAFVLDNPAVGYTQSLNYLAAFTLLVYGAAKSRASGAAAGDEAEEEARRGIEEDTFWTITALARRMLRGYHCADLGLLHEDLSVFATLLELKLPRLAARTREIGPPRTVLRVNAHASC